MDEEYQRDEDLRQQQGGRTFRVGKVLRGTYDAGIPELEPAMTRLMLELTHVPFGEDDRPASISRLSQPAEAAPRSPVPAPQQDAAPSLWRRIAARLRLA